MQGFLVWYGRHGHNASEKTWSKYTMLRTVKIYQYDLKTPKATPKAFEGIRKMKCVFTFEADQGPPKSKTPKKKKKIHFLTPC